MDWSIGQLRAFIATVQNGSFSAAARAQGKAQSRISTSVANLEIDMGLTLFDRSGRLPVLTAEGQRIYNQVCNVLQQCERLSAQVDTLTRGEELQVTLALDEAVPSEILDQVIEPLATKFPYLQLTLIHGTHGDIAHWVESGRVDLGVVFKRTDLAPALEQITVGQSHLVLVVGQNHPLVESSTPTIEQLANYRQFVICDLEGQPYSPPVSPDFWRVDSYFTALPLVSAGHGWAVLPDHVVASGWHSAGLVTLSTRHLNQFSNTDLSVIRRRAAAEGPVIRWLMKALSDALASAG